MARSIEAPRLQETLIDVIEKNPCPHPARSKRGRPPVHSKAKLDFACLHMTASNDTYRETESALRTMNTPWDGEPVPDHTTLVRHFQTIPEDWLDEVLAEIARRCIEAAGGATGPLGADSSGVETTRYEIVVKPVEKPAEKEVDFVQTRQKIYWKYHITAVLGLQIVLSAVSTPGNVNDCLKLPDMLAGIKNHGFDFSGCVFDGDRGYDSDANFAELFWMGMMPNIKQRAGAVNKDKPDRKRAAGMFDAGQYRMRALIEAIFGAEETRRHQLHCRFVREDNRRRFGKCRAISWNMRVLNRFECAKKLGISIPSYGSPARAECA